MRIADSLEKTLMLGKIGAEEEAGNRGWDGWVEMDLSLSKLWETLKDREIWRATVHGGERVRRVGVAEQQLQGSPVWVWNTFHMAP